MVPRPPKIKKPESAPLKSDLGETKAIKGSLPSEMDPSSGEPEREFLFRTFHDMRNPLHSIMGYASLVLRKTREQIPKKHQENLEKVIKSAEQLNSLVDRMVSYYRKK
jgi:signal transduction histidine kinase